MKPDFDLHPELYGKKMPGCRYTRAEAEALRGWLVQHILDPGSSLADIMRKVNIEQSTLRYFIKRLRAGQPMLADFEDLSRREPFSNLADKPLGPYVAKARGSARRGRPPKKKTEKRDEEAPRDGRRDRASADVSRETSSGVHSPLKSLEILSEMAQSEELSPASRQGAVKALENLRRAIKEQRSPGPPPPQTRDGAKTRLRVLKECVGADLFREVALEAVHEEFIEQDVAGFYAEMGLENMGDPVDSGQPTSTVTADRQEDAPV